MNTIDFIIFLVFTVGVVLFGCSFFKKGSSADEFTSAGRSLPGWLVGMSIFATYVSSISYIGYPGKAFAGNWNAFVFQPFHSNSFFLCFEKLRTILPK